MNFSVLMSVYKNDSPLYFEESLLSITAQQVKKPSQVVIVEDGPVLAEIDDIIDKVAAENHSIDFDVIKKSKNEGLARALNDGLIRCRYDWVARMDADDISDPCRFLKQCEFIQRNQDVSVLGGLTQEFVDKPGDMDNSIRNVPTEHSQIKIMAKRRTPVNHPTIMYRKEAVESVGGYSTDFGKLEDYKLWVDLITNNYIFANINEVIVHMRVGNGFIARRSNHREIEDWDNLQRYLIDGGIATKSEAFFNKVYIRAFMYTPSAVKKFLYRFLLRK